MDFGCGGKHFYTRAKSAILNCLGTAVVYRKAPIQLSSMSAFTFEKVAKLYFQKRLSHENFSA